MYHAEQFYIDGTWVEPIGTSVRLVMDPATEIEVGKIALGVQADVDRAADAAKRAFEHYSRYSVAERRTVIERIIAVYERRYDEVASIVSREMGAPISLAKQEHAADGLVHLRQMLSTLDSFQFEESRPDGVVVHEPIGVCGLITPWNWPINQISCKVVPALGAGCTMILKPSELAPFSAHLFAEIFDEAGVPPGVFNLVDGDGPGVGRALARHPDIAMISITGSNRAGVAVAEAAAPTVKRVSQELGGKSACILLPGVDMRRAARDVASRVFRNSGQSCAALTRLLVPVAERDSAVAGAVEAALAVRVGEPSDPETTMGPIANRAQFERVKRYIQSGVSEGATLMTGGLESPNGLSKGFYIRPTVFADVECEMTIAQEEIFGPVICIMTYRDEDHAVEIANGTKYGLSGAVRSPDLESGERVARRLRTGMVHINNTAPADDAPFGGYKQSGNGREWGAYGLQEFLEIKMLFGAKARYS